MANKKQWKLTEGSAVGLLWGFYKSYFPFISGGGSGSGHGVWTQSKFNLEFESVRDWLETDVKIRNKN